MNGVGPRPVKLDGASPGLTLQETANADSVVADVTGGRSIDQIGEKQFPNLGAGPAVWSPETGQFAGIPDAGTNETLQPGYGFDFNWRSFDDPIFRQDGILRPLAGQGRANPELERQGYDSVVATADETIGSIARAHRLDVAETILLNMDHIPNPALIFPGDQIYQPP